MLGHQQREHHMQSIDNILFAIQKLDTILREDIFSSQVKESVEAERNCLVAELHDFSVQQLVKFVLEFEGF
jgi:hypothetical protein